MHGADVPEMTNGWDVNRLCNKLQAQNKGRTHILPFYLLRKPHVA